MIGKTIVNEIEDDEKAVVDSVKEMDEEEEKKKEEETVRLKNRSWHTCPSILVR